MYRATGTSYKTMKKIERMTDFNMPQPPVRNRQPKKITPYEAEVERLLGENKGNWHKQRMTGARVFGILKGRHPDFRLSYPTVQRCVRAAKTRISAEGLRQGFERLVWHAGESQMDFGEADFRRDDGT